MAINNAISAISAAASSSDRRQWQRIFGVLVAILQKQESQIETLIDDRKFLEDYVQFQHDRWASKTCLLHSQVAQIKEEEETRGRAQESKSDLLIGLKEKEVECYMDHLDLLKSDLEDLYGCTESLSQQNRQLKKRFEPDKESKENDSLTGEGNGRQSEQHVSFLEGELRKLKHEFKVLSSKKEELISSLLAEKDFIWNQHKKIDEDYTSLCSMKHIELGQAIEATEKLQSIIVNLQSAATEKDDTIASLRVAVSELEFNLGKKIKEVELSNESQIKSQTDMDKLRAMLIEKDVTISRVAHEQIDEQANEATEKLQSIIYNLQSVVAEKDDNISSLRATISELELDLGQKIKEAELSNERQIKFQAELDKLRSLLNERDKTIPKSVHDEVPSRKVTKCVSKRSKGSGPPRIKERTVSSSEKCHILRNSSRQRSMDTRLTGMNMCGMSTRSCPAGNTNGLEPRLTSRKRSSCSQGSSMLFSAYFKVPKMKDLASPLS